MKLDKSTLKDLKDIAPRWANILRKYDLNKLPDKFFKEYDFSHILKTYPLSLKHVDCCMVGEFHNHNHFRYVHYDNCRFCLNISYQIFNDIKLKHIEATETIKKFIKHAKRKHSELIKK